MADSYPDFALPQRQAPEVQQIGPSPEIRAGVQQAVANPDIGLKPIQQDSRSGLLDAVIAVAGNVLKPMIARQDEAAFIQGMSRAATGVAAKEIADEQPAWANFFGPGLGELGARAYEGAKDAAQFEATALENMPQDRQLGPDEYASLTATRMNSFSTGDPIRDGQLKAAALKMMPALFKHHAQQHIAFNQEQAFKARAGQFDAAADAIESFSRIARTPGSPVTPDDRTRAEVNYLVAITPLPGEDLAIRDKSLVASLRNQMSNGKFAAYEALANAGALDELPIDQRDNLSQLYTAQGNRVMATKVMEVDPSVLDAATALRLNPPADAAKLNEAINAINSNASRVSGLGGIDLISDRERESLLEKAGLQARAAAAKQLTLAEQMAKENALQGTARALLMDSRGLQGGAEAWAKSTPEGGRALDQQAAQLWVEARQNPQTVAASWATLLKNANGHQLAPAKQTFDTALNADTWSPDLANVAKTLDAVPNDVKGLYINSDQEFLLKSYQDNVAAGLDPQIAWKTAKGALFTKPFRDPQLSKAESDAVKTEFDAWNHHWFKSNEQGPQGQALFVGMMAEAMRTAPGVTPESRAAAARAVMKTKGFDTVGNIAFARIEKGLDNWRHELNDGHGAGDDQIAEAFHAVLDKKLAVNAGFKDQTTWPLGRLKPSLPAPTLQRDASGKWFFNAIYTDPNNTGFEGRIYSMTITQADIQRELKAAGERLDTLQRQGEDLGQQYRDAQSDPTKYTPIF